MNKTEAIKATKNGFIAGCISAALTAGIALLAINMDADGKMAFFNDPAMFIDVGLILAMAYGIYKKSRVASVLMLSYFLLSKVIISIETHSTNGIVLGLIFLYFYVRAMQGAFVYHRLEKEHNPDYKPARKWSYILGIPSVLLVSLLFLFALLSTTGVIPSTRVMSGNEVRQANIDTLRAQGILNPNEDIDYFYAQGVFSILDAGNILTKDYVVVYLTDEDQQLQVYELPIHEITDVTMVADGGYFDDSVYKVSTAEEDRWLLLFLSTDQKGDQKFVNALLQRIQKYQSN